MDDQYVEPRWHYHLQRLLTILLVAAIAWGLWRVLNPANDEAFLGRVESKEAGFRAAVKKLAIEISNFPGSEEYLIYWVGPDPDQNQRVDRRALFYRRSSQWLGYEQDVYSGTSGKAYIVDDAAIRAVAEKSGTLNDFAEYDKSR